MVERSSEESRTTDAASLDDVFRVLNGFSRFRDGPAFGSGGWFSTGKASATHASLRIDPDTAFWAGAS